VEPSDQELVAACRGGDPSSFEMLYRRYAGRVYSLATRMVGSGDAEDLTQEIFLQLHRKLGSYRGDAALGTWVYRLAMNLCLDHLRSRSARNARATDGLEDAEARVATVRMSEPGVRLDLERAIARLPDGARAAFLLHDVEGLDHREVARVLGVTEGTSKSQVYKARMRLRELLRPADPIDGALRTVRRGDSGAR
jgi:RNA polymerase sigma-70 factor (ECF subfamily)